MELSSNVDRILSNFSKDCEAVNGSSGFDKVHQGDIELRKTCEFSNGLNASNGEDQIPMQYFNCTKERKLSFVLSEIQRMTAFTQKLKQITDDLIGKMHSIYGELSAVQNFIEHIQDAVDKIIANDGQTEPSKESLEWKVKGIGQDLLQKLNILADDVKDHLSTVDSMGCEFIDLADDFASYPIASNLQFDEERVFLDGKIKEICQVVNRNTMAFRNFQSIEFDHVLRYNNLENEVEKFDSMYYCLITSKPKKSCTSNVLQKQVAF